MKQILVTEDGQINEEGINSYIKKYGTNEPYNKRGDIHYGKTLLYVAVSSTEISSEMKLRLVSYLLAKGEIINHFETTKTGGLLSISLAQEDLELADLLLKAKANPVCKGQKKSIFRIALETRNEKVILWTLQNLKEYFNALTPKELFNNIRQLAEVFLHADPDLNQAAKNLLLEYLTVKISSLALADPTIAALILAAKMSTKNYDNSIFVITADDRDELTNQIKNFLTNEMSEDVIKFQIVYLYSTHAIFGEFEIDKRTTPPTVTYLHCDPAPDLIAYDALITEDFIETICPLANLVVCDSFVRIQKGYGCLFISIDGAMMLATPSDRPYVENVMVHIKKHPQVELVDVFKEEKKIYKDNEMKYLKSMTLPVRFLQGLQFIEKDEKTGGYLGNPTVRKSIFDTENETMIVNKQRETAKETISKDLSPIEQPTKSGGTEIVTFNVRAKRKMENYKKSVIAFVEKNNILDKKFSDTMDQFKINGLVKFCEFKIHKPKSRSMARE